MVRVCDMICLMVPSEASWATDFLKTSVELLHPFAVVHFQVTAEYIPG